MTFVTAALIVAAVASVLLGLTCYHLLTRLDRLEEAVLGGLGPPTRRLTREQFERRFRQALGAARLAQEVQSGVVVVLGPEAAAPSSEFVTTLAHLDRVDGIHVRIQGDLELGDRIAPIQAGRLAAELTVATTPWVFVVDDGRIRHSQPVSSAAALVTALAEHG